MQDITTSEDTELNDNELHLYSRHILLEGWDITAQQQLKHSRVLIIGAGGIGCTSSELLARAGVGHISIVDFDIIETSNLQRQTAFDTRHLGQYKVEVLAQRLQQINPHIKVQAIRDKFDSVLISSFAKNFDLVLDGCDNFATRYLVNRYCVENNIPLLSAAAISLHGQLMFVRGRPCYQCIFPEQESRADERRCANSGVLTTTPVVLASLQAHHALLYLGLGQAPLLDKLLLWDGQSMQQRELNLTADPKCACCAK